MAKTVQSIFKDVSNAINDDNGKVGKLFSEIEKRSGRGRKEAASILMSVIVTALIFVPSIAELFCNLICFGYPAMKTLAEIESNKKNKCKQWMFYWVVFSLFTITDYFSGCIDSILPIYWLLKCIFFVWLFMPSSLGTEILYGKFFQSRYSQYISGRTTAVEMTTE
ncbi:Receptor expression-enhancing protein 5 [Trichinella pseudospiralis]|uniref:Receptor expression-enhancing protein n=2 Tax=Trichinella pseudospiralis TaxID=6337 RepID=A0A0V1FZY6_TRIPS|nr:Receptor expression-enhancing protein 5 [Trichinella pseudospiralis]KRY78131.1 Receptor expression-enhancing protein 5 [Trichinella pseudospiralis]KRY91457.1 Receptor expression-enhancing protein 5 [Trichinella pseudospiralis]KRZ29749.1 Receptor expression-enhancing protein 5 [Trichinella pseudospiralis]KRZ40328.1 Receptor expression-enhancing protein 5 [Trichinella pseudospiralis]